ncbi:hypothetical protein E2C01_081242 [Portunus trituberculatus]|uniref:Uncharacterized protein n=1 Tax=Portunus trituberculatus TaxID=210409 RepID=A0A5B7IXF3_PORTR|nr:hypothetical protein [Portunus trituberculatus]
MVVVHRQARVPPVGPVSQGVAG